MKEFLDPKNDYVFKRLFGTERNKEILLLFLNDIFDGVYQKIEDVTFLPPHQFPESDIYPQSYVDLSCRDAEGKQFIVEMQCYGDRGFLQRACFYTSRAYANQMKKGLLYAHLKPVVFLAITDTKLFPKKESYLSHSKLLDIKTHECLIEEFSYSFLELGKIDKTFEESKTIIEKWAYFFKKAPDTSDEEMEEISRDYPPIGLAYEALDRCNYTPEEMDEYYRRTMNADSIATSLSDAKAEGEAKGKAEEKRNMVLSFHCQGVDKNIIATAAGLSLEEVKKILSEANEK
jgi:predicted transposase/invertase (TIGR01784 family)